MTTRAWFRIHSFTGVITGLMLFVICWSGTFAVVSNEIDWLVMPAMRVTPQTERATWGAIERAAQAAVPQAKVSGLQAPLNVRAAATVWMEQPDGDTKVVWVNPYTAEVTGVSAGRYTVQRFFRSFHMNLFLPEVGLYLVTAFSITLLVSLVAALYFYKRWWTRFFRFKAGGGRVFWSELHKTGGLWSLWFLLVIALTGAWYLFEMGRVDFGYGKVNYAGLERFAVRLVPEPASDPSLPVVPLERLLAEVEAIWPALEARSIWYDSPVEGAVYVEGRAGFPLARDRANQITLDARTGEVLLRHGWDDLPPYWLWSNMADPLHFGDFGGLWSKSVWFVFGLVLCGLIFTGTYLHAQRLAREAGGCARHRWPGTGAAIAVSLLVLAASVPFGFQEAREYYGPTVDGVKQLPTLAPGVKAVIVGWVALTLAIIAGWVWLLWRPQTFTLRAKYAF